MLTPARSRFETEYVLEASRFIWRNVVVQLQRILVSPSQSTSVAATLPVFSDLKPLDASDSYIVQATVRLENGADPKLRQRGQRDLDDFQERMKGVVDMRPADRLSLDTRVK